MQRSLLCVVTLLALFAAPFAGCKKDAGSAAPPSGGAAEPSATDAPPPVKKRFVLASSLRLRAAPDKRAKTRGRVQINYPLQVLEEQHGFARVRVKNGKTGWVGAAFLGDAPVTAKAALETAQGAVDAKERLTWLQRAAALEPADTKILGLLRDTYGEVSNERAAGMVDRLIGRLSRRFHAVPQLDDGVWIEWQTIDEELEEDVAVPEAQWSKYGLSRAMTFWVLPSTGKAVQGSVVAVRKSLWNECGGQPGVEARVDVRLPDGARALVATREDPPTSWTLAGDEADLADAERKITAWVADNVKDASQKPTIVVAPAPGGALAQVWVWRSEEEDGLWSTWDRHELFVKDGAVEVRGKDSVETTYPDAVLGERDVTGDGKPDRVSDDNCATHVRTSTGEHILSSEVRCCGC